MPARMPTVESVTGVQVSYSNRIVEEVREWAARRESETGRPVGDHWWRTEVRHGYAK